MRMEALIFPFEVGPDDCPLCRLNPCGRQIDGLSSKTASRNRSSDFSPCDHATIDTEGAKPLCVSICHELCLHVRI